jgi:hypothetical protein
MRRSRPSASGAPPGAQGYQAIAGGVDVFHSFLADLKGMVNRRARVDGPTAAFGKLYRLLSRTLDDPDFDAVRNIMRDVTVENFAIESGKSILGEPVEKRRLHSILTLAHEAFVHHQGAAHAISGRRG